jgi:hypothetical protein
MNRLEDNLRAILRRREPPDGFAARVLARLALETGRRHASRATQRHPWFHWAAAAALVLVLVGAPLAEYHRRREGEAARAEAILALRIASNQLNSSLKKVVELQPARSQSDGGGRSE